MYFLSRIGDKYKTIKPHPPTFRTLERGSFIISDEALNSLSPDMKIHILLSVLYAFVWNYSLGRN